MTDEQLEAFAEKAKRYHLDINIETSASDNKTTDDAVRIALKTGASSVRFIRAMKVHCLMCSAVFPQTSVI